MDKKLGEIFKQIRVSKNLSQRELEDEVIKQAQISRFESGTTSISIDKFFRLCENVGTSLAEFQVMYYEYNMTTHLNLFATKLSKAAQNDDLDTIRKILKSCETRLKENPKKKMNKLEEIIVKSVYAKASPTFRVLPEDTRTMAEYLIDIEIWGEFEFWAFNCCRDFFERGTLKLLGNALIDPSDFYESNYIFTHMKYITMLNLVNTWINLREYTLATKFIKYLESRDLTVEYMELRLELKRLKGLYLHKRGDSSGLQEMRKCIEVYRTLGYDHIASRLENGLT